MLTSPSYLSVCCSDACPWSRVNRISNISKNNQRVEITHVILMMMDTFAFFHTQQHKNNSRNNSVLEIMSPNQPPLKSFASFFPILRFDYVNITVQQQSSGYVRIIPLRWTQLLVTGVQNYVYDRLSKSGFFLLENHSTMCMYSAVASEHEHRTSFAVFFSYIQNHARTLSSMVWWIS